MREALFFLRMHRRQIERAFPYPHICMYMFICLLLSCSKLFSNIYSINSSNVYYIKTVYFLLIMNPKLRLEVSIINMVVLEAELNRLRQFLVLGLPVHDTCDAMGISRATYFRYKKRINRENKKFFFKDAEENMMSTLVLFNDRLGQTIAIMTKIECDEKKTEFVRMQASRIKLEATWAQTMLQAEGPNIISKLSKTIRAIAYGKPIDPQTLANPQFNNNSAGGDNNAGYVLSPANQIQPGRPPSPLPEPPIGDNWPDAGEGEEGDEEDGYEPDHPLPTEEPDPDPTDIMMANRRNNNLNNNNSSGAA